MPRGGKREGAGRKPKGMNAPPVIKDQAVHLPKVSTVVIDAVNAVIAGSHNPGHVDCLEVIRGMMTLPMPKDLSEERERWERAFRLECAKALAPYRHSKQRPVEPLPPPPPPLADTDPSNMLARARRIAFALEAARRELVK